MGFGHRVYKNGDSRVPNRLRDPAFTPIFVAARLPGWTAHITAQPAASSLIRPLATYSGPARTPPVLAG
jgi:citrate synthase